jgi:hypothetical protein
MKVAKSRRMDDCSVRSASCRPGSSAAPSLTSQSASSDPFAPRQVLAAPAFQLAKPADEIPGKALLADPVALQQAGDHREHLTRAHRLGEVIGGFGTDGVTQGVLALGLGDHHHRHGRVDLPELRHQVEAPGPRHLLVKQYHAVRLAAQQRQGVITVGRPLHRETLLLQEEDLRVEGVDLVVYPEDAARTGHDGN